MGSEFAVTITARPPRVLYDPDHPVIPKLKHPKILLAGNRKWNTYVLNAPCLDSTLYYLNLFRHIESLRANPGGKYPHINPLRKPNFHTVDHRPNRWPYMRNALPSVVLCQCPVKVNSNPASHLFLPSFQLVKPRVGG
ncbi:MAG: hypothetical protein AB2754_15905 [Candidatus Thiodiazotropha endolucinida]